LRAFVALDVPSPDILDELVALQGELGRSGADIKAVERENLHFTVKFLGEISEAVANEADARLRSLQLTAGEVTIMGVGAFPHEERPRVIWAGVAQEDRSVVTPLAEASIRALDGIGETDDRGFQPHITLARVRSGRNREILASLIRENHSRVFGRVRLTEIKLKSSILTPGGPVYNDIGVYLLR
jgi:2'-5' RNA ligase